MKIFANMRSESHFNRSPDVPKYLYHIRKLVRFKYRSIVNRVGIWQRKQIYPAISQT